MQTKTLTHVTQTLAALCFMGLVLLSHHTIELSFLGKLRHLVPHMTDASSLNSRSQTLIHDGNRETDLSTKITNYCSALSAMGRSLAFEPMNAKTLLNWANLRQLLGQTQCNLPYTEGIEAPVVEMALSIAKTNPSIRYSAALLFLWSNGRDRARQLFKESMQFGLEVTSGQEMVMAMAVEKPEDIAAIIPPRFPYVVSMHRIYTQTPAIFETLENIKETVKIVNNLQLEALIENRKEYTSGKISSDIFEERLISLLPYAQSSARQFIDRELAQSVFTYAGSVEQAFFARRSGLDEISIVPSVRTLDTRPLKSALVNWNYDERINIFNPVTSIGFFLSGTKPIRLISMQSETAGYSIEPQRLRVLVSDNNQEWSDITDSFQIRALRVKDMSWIEIFAPKPFHSKYWKIHYAGTERNRQFVGRIKNILHAYGEMYE